MEGFGDEKEHGKSSFAGVEPMITCAFSGDMLFEDKDLADNIKSKWKKILPLDRDFQVFIPRKLGAGEIFCEVTAGIQRKHPDKNIRVITVKGAKSNLEDAAAEEDEEDVMRLDIPKAKRSNAIGMRAKRIERWCISQADYVFYYWYELLARDKHTTIGLIWRLKRNKRLDVLDITSARIAQAIEDEIKNLSGQEKYIIEETLRGKSYRTVAQELGLSEYRISEIDRQSHYKIRLKISQQV